MGIEAVAQSHWDFVSEACGGVCFAEKCPLLHLGQFFVRKWDRTMQVTVN